jgi:DNA-binding transcriptional LysR family regulator
MISLYQWRTFLGVAETGSVRETAERLVVSQPAVSSALASLARELGVPLVERSGRGIQITEAGREVARSGRLVFALIDETRHRARALGGPHAGKLRIAAVTTSAEHLIPRLLSGFRARSPHVDVDLEVANRERVWNRLEHWEVDLALAGRTPLDLDFRTLATSNNELVVVARPGATYSQSTLGKETWLLRELGSGTRGATEEFFVALGISPPCLTIGSNGAIRECVRAGLGVSLLSRDAIQRDLDSATLAVVPTPITPISRAWHLVAHSGRELSPPARQFVEFAVSTSFARA